MRIVKLEQHIMLRRLAASQQFVGSFASIFKKVSKASCTILY